MMLKIKIDESKAITCIFLIMFFVKIEFKDPCQ